MVRTLKQTPAEAAMSALQSEYAPFYAVAGMTDALTQVLKSALADTRERAGESFSTLQRRGAGAGKQAAQNAEDIRTFLISVPHQVRNLPAATRARIVDLQQQANELMARASSTYGQLAGRGKRAVDEVIGTAWELSDRAERRAESVLSDVADRVDPAFERVQESVTQARKAATGRTATETMIPRSAAKAAATRRAAAKNASTNRAPAKKAATASKPTTKKATAKK